MAGMRQSEDLKREVENKVRNLRMRSQMREKFERMSESEAECGTDGIQINQERSLENSSQNRGYMI
jgi:hypothetical protein